MMTTMSRCAVVDEEEYQPKEQLEEAGDMTAREMAAAALPQKEVGKKFSGETTESNFAAEWQVKAIVDRENGMGDLVDLPTDEE